MQSLWTPFISFVADKWPKRSDGRWSCAGTTATIAIIKDRRLYIAQLGDLGLVLASRNRASGCLEGTMVTPLHKPHNPEERRG